MTNGTLNGGSKDTLDPHAPVTNPDIARVSNLFGVEYATLGVLGEPGDVLGDSYEDPRFVSPGAPRAAWFGLEWSPR